MFWIYFLFTVLLNTYITVFFRAVKGWNLDNLVLVVINYLICLITGYFYSGSSHFDAAIFSQPWYIHSVILGLSFFSIFLLIGFCSKNIGVGFTSVANKLSMIIPSIFGIIVYHESAGMMKIVGLILALIGVIMVMYQKDNKLHKNAFLFLFLLFLGSGYLDTYMKYMEKYLVPPEEQSTFITMIFFHAFLFGMIAIIMKFKTIKWSVKYIPAGLALGVPNYFSILALMAMLNASIYDSSVIFPINNLSIVILSIFSGIIFFKEKLNKTQWLGLLFAMSAIIILVKFS